MRKPSGFRTLLQNQMGPAVRAQLPQEKATESHATMTLFSTAGKPLTGGQATSSRPAPDTGKQNSRPCWS
jgi:hypothetical protein